MSFADYSQTAEDHLKLLVLVKSLNGLKPKVANKLHDAINSLKQVSIAGQNRSIQFRYKRSYPLENNEWGDFQAHRRVLGLIAFGQCSTENELAELYSSYDDLKQQYGSTVYDTRLIVFGFTKDGTPVQHKQKQKRGDVSPVSDKEERIGSTPIENQEEEQKEEQKFEADRLNSNISVTGQPKKRTKPAVPKKPSFLIGDSNHNEKKALQDPLIGNAVETQDKSPLETTSKTTSAGTALPSTNMADDEVKPESSPLYNQDTPLPSQHNGGPSSSGSPPTVLFYPC